MDCQLIRLQLLPFHFGEIETAARREVETHISVCPDCLRAYLELKRAAETQHDAPSDAARYRLRSAVAQELARARESARWSWWERPFAIVLAASALLLAATTVQRIASSPRPPLHLAASPAERQ
jgi:hypothetical protein